MKICCKQHATIKTKLLAILLLIKWKKLEFHENKNEAKIFPNWNKTDFKNKFMKFVFNTAINLNTTSSFLFLLWFLFPLLIFRGVFWATKKLCKKDISCFRVRHEKRFIKNMRRKFNEKLFCFLLSIANEEKKKNVTKKFTSQSFLNLILVILYVSMENFWFRGLNLV